MRRCLNIIMILLLAGFFMGAAEAINIQQTSISGSGLPDEQVDFTFRVLNDEVGGSITAVFSSEGLVYGTNTIAVPAIADVEISNGNYSDVDFSIVVPADKPAGDYVGQILTESAAHNDTVNVTLTIQESINFSLTPASKDLNILQGEESHFLLRIDNTGNTALSDVAISFNDLSKDADTLPAAQLTSSANNFDIDYNGHETVTITIDVPETQAPGSYTGNLEVNAGAVTKTFALNVVVEEPVSHLDLPAELSYGDVLRNKAYSMSFTVTNDGDTNLSDVAFSCDADSKYDVNFTDVPATIAPGIQKTIKVSFIVPEDEPNTETPKTLCDVAFASDKYTASFPLKLSPKVMLRLYDLDVYVNGKGKDVDDGDNVDIEPEAKVEVKAKVENLFSDDDNIDMDSVTLEAFIDDIDDGNEIDEESNDVKIRADHKETLIVDFEVPLQIEEGSYDMQLTIVGEDENGVEHKVEATITLELNKESHDSRIRTFSLSKSTLSCDLTTEFNVEIFNLGTRDEDEISYTIKNSQLGINIVQGKPGSYIELESDPYDDYNKFERTHTITLPAGTKAGTYTFEMNLYRDGDRLEDSKTAVLTVTSCIADQTTTTVDSSEDVQVIVPTTTIMPSEGPVVAEPDQFGVFSGISTSMWIIIGVLTALMFLLLIFVIVLAVKR